MAGNSVCPHAVKELSAEDTKIIEKYYSKYQNEYVRVGGAGYLLPSHFLHYAADIHNMPVRPTDVFVTTFPRSGTTLAQELIWLLVHDLDFDTAKFVPFGSRAPFVELCAFQSPKMKTYITELNGSNAELQRLLENSKPATQILADSPSPRLIKSHLPLSLLPTGTLDSKVVYVARDPRDVMVSCYYFYKSNLLIGFEGDFKEYFDLFLNDLTPWEPYFDHVKEAWTLRHHPNMLFIFYEELSKDLNSAARRVARFLGKQYTDEQYGELCEFLSFSNFQKSKAINPDSFKYTLKHNNFIRRGKVGGWRDYFDEEMTKQAERWMQAHIQDTDLCFPQCPDQSYRKPPTS